MGAHIMKRGFDFSCTMCAQEKTMRQMSEISVLRERAAYMLLLVLYILYMYIDVMEMDDEMASFTLSTRGCDDNVCWRPEKYVPKTVRATGPAHAIIPTSTQFVIR